MEVYSIADLTTSDYTDALKGVGAVIHVASPLYGTEAGEKMIKVSNMLHTYLYIWCTNRTFQAAVEGTMNLVRQAASAGVKRVVVTSSLVTAQGTRKHEFLYDDFVLSEKDWNPATLETALEDAKGQNEFHVYGIAKTVAERELWKFAEVHPELDITTSKH